MRTVGLVLFALLLASSVSAQDNPTLTTGWIIPYITAAPPVGCLAADGGERARVDYPTLYAALDPAYQIDADTFVLPDLRGRFLLGAGAGTSLTARVVGQSGGSETQTLTVDQLPAHNHTVTDPGHSHGIALGGFDTSAAGNFAPADVSGAYGFVTTTNSSTSSSGITVNSAGGGVPVGIMPPYSVVRYCVLTGTTGLAADPTSTAVYTRVGEAQQAVAFDYRIDAGDVALSTFMAFAAMMSLIQYIAPRRQS